MQYNSASPVFETGCSQNLSMTVGYDTIEEINVDSKAEYTA